MSLSYENVREKIVAKLNELAPGAGAAWDGARRTGMLSLQTAEGVVFARWEVGKEYPGLEGSAIVSIHTAPSEDGVPGDVRVYTIPPQAEETSLLLCYTINRQTLAALRETMSLRVFVEEVAEEVLELSGIPEEGEEPACQVEDCEKDVAYVCLCDACKDLAQDEKWFVCADHRATIDPDHLKEMGRPALWQKVA